MTRTLAQAWPDLWRVEITVPGGQVLAFEQVMERYADSVSWFMSEGREAEVAQTWHLEAFSRTKPDKGALETALSVMAAACGVPVPDVRYTREAQRNWLIENMSAFPPISVGRYFIHGSHFKGRALGGRIALRIDAGAAFGSGEHQTTLGCLTALDALARRRRFSRPLDVGCGSGILALAAARTWGVPVRAVDIDPMAVRIATVNARANRAGHLVRTALSDGFRSRFVAAGRPYDLVLANILARPLQKMAARLASHLTADGVAVLSGLLSSQERRVLSAYRLNGLRLRERCVVGEWSTLVLSR